MNTVTIELIEYGTVGRMMSPAEEMTVIEAATLMAARTATRDLALVSQQTLMSGRVRCLWRDGWEEGSRLVARTYCHRRELEVLKRRLRRLLAD